MEGDMNPLAGMTSLLEGYSRVLLVYFDIQIPAKILII